MRVLITGHDGYIGRILAPIMRDAGYQVSGLDAFLFEGCSLGPEREMMDATRLDIRDIQAHHLRGFDAVIHLAGISNDPLAQLNPELTYEINHRATVRLGRLAKEAGVARFIQASSCSLYGAASSTDALTESAPFNPVTPYGESKVLAERELASLADDSFSPIFLRNATVYGYSPRLRLDLVVNDLVASAFVSGEFTIKSDGTPWRPLVHIQDVAHATIAALQARAEAVHNEAFNIGRAGENYQVRDLVEIVRDAVPESRAVYEEGAGPDLRSYRVDFSKAETALPGFSPQWTVADGVRELLHEYRRYGLDQDALRSPRFVRLRHIQSQQREGRLGSDLRAGKTSLA